jgi:hypothetical protein
MGIAHKRDEMAYYKRPGIYHCDFTINGHRYRQTLETTDWREAKKREDKKARAREGKLASGITAEFSRLSFDLAAHRYLAEVAVRRPGGVRNTVGSLLRSDYLSVFYFALIESLPSASRDPPERVPLLERALRQAEGNK